MGVVKTVTPYHIRPFPPILSIDDRGYTSPQFTVTHPLPISPSLEGVDAPQALP